MEGFAVILGGTREAAISNRRKDLVVSQDQTTQQDPTEQHAAPGSGDETVEYPGRSEEMDVQPDHGEQT